MAAAQDQLTSAARSTSTTEAAERAAETQRLFSEISRTRGTEREALREQVILLNRVVAESVARRFRDRGEPLDDLVQVAYVGLTKAVRGFDPDKGTEFLSYAVPTISGEIKRYFRDCAWAVRPPRRIQELQAQIGRAAAELAQDLGRSARPSEIAERLDVAVEDVSEALSTDGCFTPSSLDERGPDDDKSPVGERLGADDDGFDRVEAVALLTPVCRRLKPRDRRILYLRFFRGWTQAHIAADLGVTQMQVSRLLTRILRDLREDVTGTVPPARNGRRRSSDDVA